MDVNVKSTITNLQTTYPNLSIPTDPVEALNYLAKTCADAFKSLETYQKSVVPVDSRKSAKFSLLPRKR